MTQWRICGWLPKGANQIWTNKTICMGPNALSQSWIGLQGDGGGGCGGGEGGGHPPTHLHP